MIDAKAEPCSILFESMNWGLDKRWGHKFVNFGFNYFGGANLNQRYFCATWFCLGQMLLIYVSYHGHRKRTVWAQYHNLQMIWIIRMGNPVAWRRGPKSLNSPDGNFQHAKTLQTKCVNRFCAKKARKSFLQPKKCAQILFVIKKCTNSFCDNKSVCK